MKQEEMWQAIIHCDASYDGKFYYGVKTTGIYCRPSCKSRVPKLENVCFFTSQKEAEEAGFRPCKRCRPDIFSYDPIETLASQTKEIIDQHFQDPTQLNLHLKNMGVTRKHASAVFKKQYDITLSDYIRQTRMAYARQLLQDGLSILDVSLEVGDSNLSSFYDQFHREIGMSPARYRQIFAKDISRTQIETPIGNLQIMASKEAILCIEQSSISIDPMIHADASGKWIEACCKELKEYFDKERTSFDLPLALEGTDFQKQVWQQLQTIPYGQTRTYGEIAAQIGHAKASRAVGMANHNNPILILVPCHRVIGADGSLTGYAAGLEAKKYLLALEKMIR
ncbi:bifunctional transcriptional activator/DNA repair enzyme AdaA [Absicoccus intestinalis]|uniref:bifunctional transcriptional activator/DNA repair enzyme AdaA n=1 Tax=Absicoccus intestinalis TaxID=2926319 RepID=UPI002A249723|nr:methylated-DNA--[protein]-cysteine S-methyltransferase [Absicoccus sp. CLA-KB-P134]